MLCGHLKYGGCDVSDSIEHSEHTYGDVLQKLFNRTPEFEARKDEEDGVTFEAGKLCTICKVRLQTLYRLQKELRDVSSCTRPWRGALPGCSVRALLGLASGTVR